MAQDLRTLVERARRGDREAFGELVRKHQERAYGVAYRMMGNHDDADDVAQEAFLRAYRGLSKFDARSDFFTWLYRIVINVALNHLRSGKRRGRTAIDEVVVPEHLQAEADKDPRRALELKRMVHEIGEALDGLSDSLRATLVLVVFEGLPYRDAAEVLECSEGTVAWRVHEARRQLRDTLGKYLKSNRAGDDDGDERTVRASSGG